MKRSIVSLLALFAVATAQAGSFGPPPFTNGSPLTTGVTGTYQASARGNGVSGIIRFSYNSNGNPSTAGFNDYMFFVDGTVVRGVAEVAIMDTTLAGILNTPTSLPFEPPTLGYFDSLGGAFSGKFNTKSPYYSFKGKGDLQVYTSEGGAPISGSLRNFRISGMRTSLNSVD